MNERMVVLSFDDGEVGVTLGANYRYFTLPFALTVIFVTPIEQFVSHGTPSIQLTIYYAHL